MGAMRIHITMARSFGDRQSAEERLFGVSNLRSQNRRDAATPDRPIVRCGKSHNEILAVPRQSSYPSSSHYLICPRSAVSASPRAGGAKYLIAHIETSRSRYPSIIRSESAVRRKNLKTVRRIGDASRPRPAGYAAPIHRCLSSNQQL